MRYFSVCSGIEAASVAWGPLGWKAAWFSEVAKFPSAVLAHHYPDVPNHGDMADLPKRILSGEVEAPGLLVGGTPCQAFSVAGQRNSLDDARGNLSLIFCEIANAIDFVRKQQGEPGAIIFWENVVGALNTPDNFFGNFLAKLSGEDVALEPSGSKWPNAGCVYGPKRTIAWRVFDAKYFGLAQRRRRIFLCAVDNDSPEIRPEQILFEYGSPRRDTPPDSGPKENTPEDCHDGIIVGGEIPDITGTLLARDCKGLNKFDVEENKFFLIRDGVQVFMRRFTPVEYERLQGFPDDYTNIPWRGKAHSPDGPRYSSIGNSWAVPVVRWIGERINNAVNRL